MGLLSGAFFFKVLDGGSSVNVLRGCWVLGFAGLFGEALGFV